MKAVLLDRDGVINKLIYHQEAGIIDSPFTLSQFNLFPLVPKAIKLLNSVGLRVAVVSNQPGIGKGHLQPNVLKSFDRQMLTAVERGHGRIDGIYYCFHHPEAEIGRYRKRCDCRKPEIGLLRQAARDMHVSLSDCYMIGDGLTDLLAGRKAGCRTVFIGRWKCEICQFAGGKDVLPDLVAKDLWEAANVIASEAKTMPSAKLLPIKHCRGFQVHTRVKTVRRRNS